jgi:hypothetical protein
MSAAGRRRRGGLSPLARCVCSRDAGLRQKREMAKAVRAISFDCSQQGLEVAPSPLASLLLLLCLGPPVARAKGHSEGG